MSVLKPFAAAALALGVGLAQAADVNVTIELPRLKVAEYHKPYVASWIEREDNSVAANLLVWYDTKLANKEGEKWLKDMRQWWRRSGREQQMPIDGVSGATRGPGEHVITFKTGKAPLNDLPAGNYKLVVEAAREVGGRELITVPFSWPVKKAETHKAQGSSELGKIIVELKP